MAEQQSSFREERYLHLANQLDRESAKNLFTRVRLLRLHGWKGFLIGWVILFTGTASAFETQIGSWTRPATGGLAIICGGVLLAGVYRRRGRNHRLEIIGLWLMGVWDVTMAFGLIYSMYVYGSLVVQWPWDLSIIDPGQPRPFGPLIYVALAAMVWGVHLVAAIWDVRDERRSRTNTQRYGPPDVR